MLASMLASSVFDPRRIPGLEAWWDAADSASVTLDSGRVSQWNDKSGNGRHAANTSSGSTQPDYITQGRNSLNVVRFTAASTQRLTVASSTATFKFLHDGTASWFVAVSSYGTSSNPTGSFALFGNNATASGNVGLMYGYDDRGTVGQNDGCFSQATIGTVGQFAYHTFNAALTGLVAAYNNILTPNTTLVQEAAIDADNATASNRFALRINGGTAIAANEHTFSPSTSNAGFNLQLGCSGNNGTALTGDICEIMFFSQQPTTDACTAIRRYLARKWGVALS